MANKLNHAMKLIIITIILFCSGSVFAQRNNPVPSNLSTKLDTINFKVDYTNHCLNNFRKEKQLGLKLMLGGAIISYIANDNSINGYNKAHSGARIDQTKLDNSKSLKVVGLVTGGAMVLSGVVFQIISYRHLGRAYLVPDKNGLTVGYKF